MSCGSCKVADMLEGYVPYNDQERLDKYVILDYLRTSPDIFLRSNLKAHMTASAWIVNRSRTKVLMVFHRIYDSWSWTGGHADGDEDLLAVAMREAREETGVEALPVSPSIFSIEQLPVDGHYKNGLYVPSHMHLNVSYLLEADDSAPLKVKADENKAVAWFGLDEALTKPSPAERWVVDHIYAKLNSKLKEIL